MGCVYSQQGVVVCLFLFFTPHQQTFSYKGTGLPGLNQSWARINALAQGHNTVMPVRLEPAAPRSGVGCSCKPLDM